MSECPACTERRLHTVREWRDYHPHAGHGYQEGQGYTQPEPEESHDDIPEPVAS